MRVRAGAVRNIQRIGRTGNEIVIDAGIGVFVRVPDDARAGPGDIRRLNAADDRSGRVERREDVIAGNRLLTIRYEDPRVFAGFAARAQKAQLKGAPTEIETGGEEVTGFIFKIQANMDPKHRDRVGFFRICSGRFKRGMTLRSAVGKSLNVHNPLMFLAQEREIADEAFPGDVIGIPSHGGLRVGDSLSESGEVVFSGIPNFAPEILKRVRVRDPLKQKHLRKALEALGEEGVTQVFKPVTGGDLVVGAVGGGEDGETLLARWVAAARGGLLPANMRSVVVTGPMMPEDAQLRVIAAAPASCTVTRYIGGLEAYAAAADLIEAMHAARGI